jgi:predicted RecB family nuclease
MQREVAVIWGGCLEATISGAMLRVPLTIGGRVDRLERQADGVYAPIQLRRYTVLRDGDMVQLEFLTWLLCIVQGVQTLPAAFWLGADEDGFPLITIEQGIDVDQYADQLGEVVQMLAAPEPPVHLIPACKECHWRSSCYPAAADGKHVSLLSKLTRKTMADFAAAGIFRLDQITAMQPDDLRQFHGIKSRAVAIHASARAWVEERAIWYGRLHDACRTEAYYFDIETLQNTAGDTEVWSIGWSAWDGTVNVIIVAPEYAPSFLLLDDQPITLVADAAAAWCTFAAAAGEGDQPIFHWTGYDSGVMKKSAPAEVTAKLLPRLRDLCALFDRAVKLPVKGVSLKVVARYLGFHWHGYEDWFAAYSDYVAWRHSGEERLLASACHYQSDDVEAMRVVMRWLVENAPVE